MIQYSNRVAECEEGVKRKDIIKKKINNLKRIITRKKKREKINQNRKKTFLSAKCILILFVTYIYERDMHPD